MSAAPGQLRKLNWGHNKAVNDAGLLGWQCDPHPTAYVQAIWPTQTQAATQQDDHGFNSIAVSLTSAGQAAEDVITAGPPARPASSSLQQRSPYKTSNAKVKAPRRPASAVAAGLALSAVLPHEATCHLTKQEPTAFSPSIEVQTKIKASSTMEHLLDKAPVHCSTGAQPHSARHLAWCSEGLVPDVPASVKAAKDQTLRDVLCSLLGSAAAHVDHYRLDITTVKELCDQQAHQAAAAARQEVAAQQTKAVQQAVEAAEREWQLKAHKDATTAKALAESEQQYLRQQLDQSRKEVAALTSERRALLAKAGQQGRDKREFEKELQAKQERVGALEKQLAACKGSLTAAERSKQEAERGLIDAQKAAAAAQARVAEAHDKLQALHAAHAMQLAEQHAEAKQQEARWAKQAQHAAAQAAMEVQAVLGSAVTEALQAVGALQTEVQDAQNSSEQQLLAAQEDVQQLRHFVASLLSDVQSSAAALQAGVSRDAASCQDVCNQVVQHMQARVTSILQMDAQLASLGPEGLDGLCSEMQQARSKLAQSSEKCSQLEADLAATEQARQTAVLQHQVQQAELAMLVRAKAELQRELVVSREEVARMADRVAVLITKAAESATQQATTNEALAATQAALKQSDKHLVGMTQQLAAKEQQLEAVHAQVAELQQHLQASHVDRQELAEQANLQVAQTCAVLLRQLRRNYFTPVGSIQAALEGRDAPAGRPGQGSTQVSTQCLPGSHAQLLVSQMMHDAEEVVGLGLCELTHEQVMQAFDSYTARQLAAAQSSASGGHESQVRTRLSSTPGASMNPITHELLWLEGCLLLMMVQLRQQERELKQLAEPPTDCNPVQDAATHLAPSNTSNASTSSSASANKPAQAQPAITADGLVAQLLRAMADDKRKLQRQVTGHTRPPSPGAASFLSYIPLRRSLSARPTLSRTSTPLPHAPGVAGSVACSDITADLSVPHASSRGCGSDAAVPDPRVVRTQDSHGIVSLQSGGSHHSSGPSDDGSGATVRLAGRSSAAGPAVPHGCLSGITPRQIIRTHSLTRPALSSLDDEVIQVLQCLDASELRCSRGMSGLVSGTAGPAEGHYTKAATNDIKARVGRSPTPTKLAALGSKQLLRKEARR